MSGEAQSRFVAGAGVRLHLLERGRGRSLVFLHGGSAHARWWDFVAPACATRFCVRALDLRGHGDSDWSPEGAYRIADYAADLRAAGAALGLDGAVLVGHSLGSFVALRVALERPGSLAALILIDGRAAFSSSGTRYMKLLRMLTPAPHARLEDAMEGFHLLPKETVAAPEVLRHVARHSFRRDDRGRWATKFDRAVLASHEPFDLRGRLAELDCPVLFVRGEHSRVLSREAAARFAATCRRASWAEIPDAHHHVLLDRPQALAAEMAAFLERNGLGSDGV